MAVFSAALARIHVRCIHSGAMGWGALQWSHVACGIRGLRPVTMAAYRFGFAAYVFCILVLATSGHGRQGRAALAGGPTAFATFTVWCWSLIGVYGIAAGIVSALAAAGVQGSSPCAAAAACVVWVLFEVMFSCAVLVFLVVWLVLIPQAYVMTHTDLGLLGWQPVSMHNLNLLFMMTEMLLNRLIFVPAHALFAMYYGITYIVFSWLWFAYAGVFFYFFIDWRRPLVVLGYTVLIALVWASFVGGQQLTRWAKRGLMAELPGEGFPVARETSAAESAEAATS
uniref:Glycerophosphocholine acyltransferase 1 n=1 Tax=Pyrodinium bahamense TaxID=73915 RepID=A0A7S0FBS4_9DINO